MDIANLVKKATTPPKTGNVFEVSPTELSCIKQVCKTSADAVKEVFYYLSLDLTKRSGVVRLRALAVMDCILHRSKTFRDLVCSDIKHIAQCTGLLCCRENTSSFSSAQVANSAVPAATTCAAELESKAKEFIEIWDHLYGDRNPQLRAVARYFRESLRLPMPNIMVTFAL